MIRFNAKEFIEDCVAEGISKEEANKKLRGILTKRKVNCNKYNTVYENNLKAKREQSINGLGV